MEYYLGSIERHSIRAGLLYAVFIKMQYSILFRRLKLLGGLLIRSVAALIIFR
jgi:hypothetical protein